MIDIQTKICSDCCQEKEITKFAVRRHLKNGETQYRPQCKDCWSKREIIRYRAKRDFIDSQRTKCVKCGDTRFYLLDFHHLDPSKKEFTIGVLRKGNLEKIQREIDKCAVLCANCHREFHYLNSTTGITFDEYLSN